jgi:hypothetical protein
MKGKGKGEWPKAEEEDVPKLQGCERDAGRQDFEQGGHCLLVAQVPARQDHDSHRRKPKKPPKKRKCEDDDRIEN